MKIFVLNRGSSSIKCFLYVYSTLPSDPVHPLWEAQLEWKNSFESPRFIVKNANGKSLSGEIKVKTAGEALGQLLSYLYQGETAVLSSLDEIDIAGHRIVHGGRDFHQSVLIDAGVKKKIRALIDLAPLHNLPELEGIEILGSLLKNTPQVAVFDTAFHHTLPKAAQIYPGPYRWYEEGIQRYGFHGISYQYCSRRAAQILGSDIRQLKMVVCHLGSGASLCAIKEGKSVDTTMGFTPLEGLMMDTRSGTIDPGILLHLLEKKKMSGKQISDELYRHSGLLGISGSSSDMRDILKKSGEGDARAALAFDVYIHRLSASIGAMAASLGGVDAIVFTGGIGENAHLLRKRVASTFSFLGLNLDPLQNESSSGEDRVLSTSASKVKAVLVHTREAFEIARECWYIQKER